VSPFTTPSAGQVNIGLLILRVIVGIVFVAHGAQKIFVWGIDGVTAGFAGMGVPAAAVVATLVAFGELLGGLALIAGVLTRLASLGLAIIMIGAVTLAHLPAGFFAPEGYEFTLTLAAASLALMFAGAGQLSVDAALAKRRR
jgi:putative oxidoreductase